MPSDIDSKTPKGVLSSIIFAAIGVASVNWRARAAERGGAEGDTEGAQAKSDW